VSAEPRSSTAAHSRGVLAWGLWDWGSSAFNAVIGTFVFTVYLTGTVGDDLPGGVSANSWLGYALGASGLLVALLAPVIGQRADAGRRRKLSVGVWTALVVACTAGL
jgi:MFS transporter, UMF1 family